MTNTAAHHFALLRAAWSIDAASHAVEVHAANLAASLLDGPQPLCSVTFAANRSLVGLRYYLGTRGVEIRVSTNLAPGDGIPLYAVLATDPLLAPKHDYDPLAVVRERDAVTN